MLKTGYTMRYDTIYDTVYLTCSKKLTDSPLSLPHGMNKKHKRKGSSISKEVKLRWEGFVEEVGFEPGVKME